MIPDVDVRALMPLTLSRNGPNKPLPEKELANILKYQMQVKKSLHEAESRKFSNQDITSNSTGSWIDVDWADEAGARCWLNVDWKGDGSKENYQTIRPKLDRNQTIKKNAHRNSMHPIRSELPQRITIKAKAPKAGPLQSIPGLLRGRRTGILINPAEITKDAHGFEDLDQFWKAEYVTTGSTDYSDPVLLTENSELDLAFHAESNFVADTNSDFRVSLLACSTPDISDASTEMASFSSQDRMSISNCTDISTPKMPTLASCSVPSYDSSSDMEIEMASLPTIESTNNQTSGSQILRLQEIPFGNLRSVVFEPLLTNSSKTEAPALIPNEDPQIQGGDSSVLKTPVERSNLSEHNLLLATDSSVESEGTESHVLVKAQPHNNVSVEKVMIQKSSVPDQEACNNATLEELCSAAKSAYINKNVEDSSTKSDSTIQNSGPSLPAIDSMRIRDCASNENINASEPMSEGQMQVPEMVSSEFEEILMDDQVPDGPNSIVGRQSLSAKQYSRTMNSGESGVRGSLSDQESFSCTAGSPGSASLNASSCESAHPGPASPTCDSSPCAGESATQELPVVVETSEAPGTAGSKVIEKPRMQTAPSTPTADVASKPSRTADTVRKRPVSRVAKTATSIPHPSAGATDSAAGAKRQRLRPLEFWRNERVEYARSEGSEVPEIRAVLLRSPEQAPAWARRFKSKSRCKKSRRSVVLAQGKHPTPPPSAGKKKRLGPVMADTSLIADNDPPPPPKVAGPGRRAGGRNKTPAAAGGKDDEDPFRFV